RRRPAAGRKWWRPPAPTPAPTGARPTWRARPLQGARPDAATSWPSPWEAGVRRASLLEGEEGVLVIEAEPHDSAVPADA
ncbi:hypothetical protein ABZ906_45865, partial [Streptomyces sp. NPDC046925]